jgi:chaperonin GroES
MKFNPTGNKVLAKRLPTEEKTHGGIIIPPTIEDKEEFRNCYAEIIAIGPGIRDKKGRLKPTSAKPGDKIMFTEFSHIKVTLEGKEYLMLREDDIVGLIDG